MGPGLLCSAYHFNFRANEQKSNAKSSNNKITRKVMCLSAKTLKTLFTLTEVNLLFKNLTLSSQSVCKLTLIFKKFRALNFSCLQHNTDLQSIKVVCFTILQKIVYSLKQLYTVSTLLKQKNGRNYRDTVPLTKRSVTISNAVFLKQNTLKKHRF